MRLRSRGWRLGLGLGGGWCREVVGGLCREVVGGLGW